jgi:hypothetical protein
MARTPAVILHLGNGVIVIGVALLVAKDRVERSPSAGVTGPS